MVEMIDWLRDDGQERICIPVGYTDHTFGYLPTSEILRQGGYEARDFRAAFSLPGEFRPEFEECGPATTSFDFCVADTQMTPFEAGWAARPTDARLHR